MAYLTVVMLRLEAPDLRVPDEFKPHLKAGQARLPRAHGQCLGTLGVAAEHLADWEKLINLRFDENARDRHDVRAAARQLESAEKELDLEDRSPIQPLVPVQAVAIGRHHHICRAKTDGRDALFKLIIKSLGKFYVQIRLSLEVGKITPRMRVRTALRRLTRCGTSGHYACPGMIAGPRIPRTIEPRQELL